MKCSTKYYRKRKKVFCVKSKSVAENVEDVAENVEDVDNNNSSVCSQKIQNIDVTTPKKEAGISGFRMIDMSILAEVISVLHCPSCTGYLKLSENSSRKQGLATRFAVAYI